MPYKVPPLSPWCFWNKNNITLFHFKKNWKIKWEKKNAYNFLSLIRVIMVCHWEFNVHICPQIHLRGTRESEAIFESPAEISVKAPLSALRSPRETRRDTKLTLSPTKKNHAICFRSHKSLHYHPQGIFLKKRVCDTFYTLCDIRFCQSINKRTKENVNHCNNQSQLKIHGYFWHNDIKRVCDSFCDIMSCHKKKQKQKKRN